MASILFDVLTTTADDLRKLLEKGSVTRVRIVESYLSHIKAHNIRGAKCRAIISTGPRFQLIAQAAVLDEERQHGKTWTEAIHPYWVQDRGQAPGGDGSSTGSAVGVACGFAPIALGTETSGSIVSPSAVAALYALKLTPGSVPLTGIMEVTACFDTVGGMGKTPLDVALTSDALLGSAEGASLASVASSVEFGRVSVGFVDIEKWRLPAGTQEDDPEYLQQTAREYQAAKDELRKNGVKVVDVYIIPPEAYMIGDTNVDDLTDSIIRQQAKAGFERYLKALKFSKVRSLEEVIEFNQAHANVEFNNDYCPNQDGLVGILKASRPDQDAARSLEHCKRWAATEGIDKAISEHGVDVVVCCSDSYFAGVSVASRYPMAAVPLGYIKSSGRPYGLQAIAPAHQEKKLVAFMAAWERIFPPRRVPDLDACAKARADW
ncbi:hypothetical protein G6O67_000720 [Ophiocordyceps sinensis]|uniref:Amidase domain-containing protein n=1 Tax=Ophiocordyceps sinensis TaxID=72228 RepID=A0A8H4Q012_9HYPO|nr:hypothetical protein G6O67_000720 [Ophiocordyceps sinensis]